MFEGCVRPLPFLALPADELRAWEDQGSSLAPLDKAPKGSTQPP